MTAADRLFFGVGVPSLDWPGLTAIPIQRPAQHAAVLKGTEVDQPRRLAKSVTIG
jgi:glucosamine 6-phosphate synthetase-like amidotransferase/phosphosugar isomerase protein